MVVSPSISAAKRCLNRWLLPAIVLVATASLVSAQVPSSERQALIDLYNSTDGPQWTNNSGWLGAEGTECSWYGVDCIATTPPHIYGLTLKGNNLHGPLPATISDLTQLGALDLRTNALNGELPALDGLTSLQFLSVIHNSMSGPVPSLADLSSLQQIFLDYNDFSGPIPALPNPSSLIVFSAYSNHLSGTIPDLSDQPGLLQVFLDFNQLTGELPELQGTSLQFFEASGNRLTGPVPAISHLTSLRGFNVGGNSLTGSLPDLQGLTSLQYLYVGGNILLGEVPPSIKSLTNLTDLDLELNGLHTADPTVAQFINARFSLGDWRTFETIAPENVSASATDPTSVTVSWTPILYQQDPGQYQIWVSKHSGGPYSMAGATTTKLDSQFKITGLRPQTHYFIVVESVTPTSPQNHNTVISDPSAEVSATTPANAPVASFSWSPSAPEAGEAVSFTDSTQGSVTSWAWSFGDPSSGSLNASSLENPSHVFASRGSFEVTLSVSGPQGSATVFSVVVVSAPPPNCVSDTLTACLNQSRFRVRVSWQAVHEGTSGEGTAVSISPDTEYFWFFDPSNVELVVKVLDGRAINGNFWVFFGALSNVAYTITITDTATGKTKTYVNPQDNLASVSDTAAFSDSARASESVQTTELPPGRNASAPRSGQTETASSGSCEADATHLCLGGGRFRVSVDWQAQQFGTSGSGTGVAISSDTGYFWFFDSANVELAVKVLDARAVNGKFWVFYGALSNVQYSLTVTDTQTGESKVYVNPQGTQASVADTSAF